MKVPVPWNKSITLYPSTSSQKIQKWYYPNPNSKVGKTKSQVGI